MSFTLDWEFGFFRDCNGVSNGKSHGQDLLLREAEAGAFTGVPAGLIGPKLSLRCRILILSLIILNISREKFELPATEKRRPLRAKESTHQNLEIDPSESDLFHIKNLGKTSLV